MICELAIKKSKEKRAEAVTALRIFGRFRSEQFFIGFFI